MEGAVGHQTVPIEAIVRKIHDFYRETVKEGIKRLVDKEDLELWPKGVKDFTEEYSVSINPKHLGKLERYLQGYSEELQRLRHLKKQFHYKGREYVWLLLGISALALALAFLGRSITGCAVLSRKSGSYYAVPAFIIFVTAMIFFLKRKFARTSQ